MRSRTVVVVAGLGAGIVLAGLAAWLPPRMSGGEISGSSALAATPAPGAGQAQAAAETGTDLFVQGESPEAAGRYIVRISGCNDCHTPGYMQVGEAVPESLWLTGAPIGFKGPWGTSYASNLRIFLKDFDEETFVKVMRQRNTRPPMVWPSLHAMSDRDLRAVFRYIKSLPVTGEKMPEAVPPGQEPKTPYLLFEPTFPPGTTPPAPASAPEPAAAGTGGEKLSTATQ